VIGGCAELEDFRATSVFCADFVVHSSMLSKASISRRLRALRAQRTAARVTEEEPATRASATPLNLRRSGDGGLYSMT
jgi:hypothetical protein